MNKQPETFWAWLAGFVDGDGTITGAPLQLSIVQVKREVLDRIHTFVGEGSICKRGRLSLGGNVVHVYRLGSGATRRVCEKLLPYLTVKRAAAEAALGLREPGPIRPHKVYTNAAHCHPKFQEAVDRYLSGEQVSVIADDLGIKGATLHYWLRSRGISRTLKEAQQLRREREKV